MNIKKFSFIVFCFHPSSLLLSLADEWRNSTRSVSSTGETSTQYSRTNSTGETSTHHLRREAPPSSKIRNGEKAGKDEFPYIVAIGHQNNSIIYSAGVIVGPKWILTAEHVIRQGMADRKHQITLNYGNRVSDIENGTKYQVSEYFCPKDYGGDIGLMKLKEAIPLNQEPHKFQKINMIGSNHKLSQEINMTVVGWGYINISKEYPVEYAIGAEASNLMKVDIQLRPDNECRSYSRFSAPKHFCTTGEERGTCKGDSGGPVVIKNGNSSGDTLIGLVSGGSGYCE